MNREDFNTRTGWICAQFGLLVLFLAANVLILMALAALFGPDNL